MELLDGRAYLEPPDNKAKPALKCYFCDADIYEGDDYYVLNGFDCCEECLDVHFKFTAELPDNEAEMFGLGLYIYSGEDLPEIETERIAQKYAVILKNMVNKMDSEGAIYNMILKRYEVKNFKNLSLKQYQDILSGLNEMARRNEERNASKI